MPEVDWNATIAVVPAELETLLRVIDVEPFAGVENAAPCDAPLAAEVPSTEGVVPFATPILPDPDPPAAYANTKSLLRVVVTLGVVTVAGVPENVFVPAVPSTVVVNSGGNSAHSTS
jgi:hypothetical protein